MLKSKSNASISKLLFYISPYRSCRTPLRLHPYTRVLDRPKLLLNHKSLIIITKWCSAPRPNKSIRHRERAAAKIISICIKIIEITNFHHAAPATILNYLYWYAVVSGQSDGSEFQTSLASRLASLVQCIALIS